MGRHITAYVVYGYKLDLNEEQANEIKKLNSLDVVRVVKDKSSDDGITDDYLIGKILVDSLDAGEVSKVSFPSPEWEKDIKVKLEVLGYKVSQASLWSTAMYG